MQDINKRMAHGAAWMIGAKLAERGIGLVSTLILARLLVPADFGLVAMAMAIVAILELMGAFGFEVALIQNRNAERRHYDTAWTFFVGFGLFCALSLALLAYPMSLFYGEPRLRAVMYVIALGSLINGFCNIGVVEFRKELNFVREFQYQLRRKLVAFAVTIVLAFTFRSYWALVLGSVAGNLAALLLSYAMVKYRPRFSLAAWRDLSSFSTWVFVNNLLAFFTHRLADLLIGRMLGAKPLGVYAISSELANIPTTELVAPINRAVLPGYAKLSNDADALTRGYLAVAGLVALLALPAGLGISAVAPLMVQVVLGENWMAAVPIIALLASRGAFFALTTNVNAICLAVGRPRLITHASFVFLIVLVPGLFAGLRWFDLEGVAYAYWLATAVQVPLYYRIAMRLLDLRVGAILRILWRPVLAGALMYVSASAFVEQIFTPGAGSLSQLPWLLAAVALGALSYFAALYGLWMAAGRPEGAEQYVLDWLRRRLFGRTAR